MKSKTNLEDEMDRYDIFRKLMDLVADDFEVVDADMKNYSGDIEVQGKADGTTIRITVELEEEEQKNGN
jgi:hypothetical protein